MIRLEKMADFFAARIDGYDEHMRTNIEGADGFYAYTASLLPQAAAASAISNAILMHRILFDLIIDITPPRLHNYS